jgi:hypothetical protein
MADDHNRSAVRGGPQSEDESTPAPPAAAAKPQDDDPLSHLTPGQRFKMAIKRRNAVIQDQLGNQDSRRRAARKPLQGED